MMKIALCLLLLSCAHVKAEQVTIPHTKDRWPNARYIQHGDGTVTDRDTGLMWQQCSLGQEWNINAGMAYCSGQINKYIWTEALAEADASQQYGYNDWRLPNVKELISLIAFNRDSPIDQPKPMINRLVFPSSGGTYWSSSFRAGEHAWVIGLGGGGAGSNFISYRNNVRLVRSVE